MELSEVGRLTGVIHAPGETFPDVSARGKWIVPTLIITVLGLLFVTLLSQRVGYDRMIQKAFDSSSRVQQLSPEQKAQAMESQRKMMPVMMYVGAGLGSLITVVVVAGILLFLMNSMMDAGLKYKNSLNIVAYAMWPVSVVSSVATLAVMFLKSPDEFDVERALAFNAGAFLNPDTTSKWLMSLASSIDLLTFWMIALMAVGYSAAVGAKKLPFSKALMGILIPWAVWVVLKIGFSSMFR